MTLALVYRDGVHGGKLSNILEEPPSSEQIYNWMNRCLMQCKAHENQMYHRDLKPSNVMIARGDIVKVIDFGTVKYGNDR